MAKKRSKKRQKRRPASRPASARPERQQDPRLVAVEAFGIGGKKLPPGHWVLGVSPVLTDDGHKVLWHYPQPVGFNLVEAKRFRDRGVKSRRNIIAKLNARADGSLSPANSTAAINCVRDLQLAVLLAFTAIESLVNQAIDTLPDDFTLTRKKKTLGKKDLVRALGVDEKLKRVMPKVAGGNTPAGSAAWRPYQLLKSLRDELVHVKQRGLSTDPRTRSAYDRLLLGEADDCVEVAMGVIETSWPDFFPRHVKAELTRKRQ